MDKVIEAARALVDVYENGRRYGMALSAIPEYKALKEALEPTREEIVDYLERWKDKGELCGEEKRYINLAIKELRK